jgi:MSHA biogenesis protein MshE
MDIGKKRFIGGLLVDHQLITVEQLQTALTEQKKSGKKIGHILIEHGFIEERAFLKVLAEQLKIPFLNFANYSKKTEVIKKLPERLARRFRALLLEDNGHDVLLAMVDPTDLMGLDELRRILGKTIRPVLVQEADLLTTIDQLYRRTDEINVLAEQLRYELTDNETDINVLLVSDKAADAPIVKLLKSVFEDAIQVGASDIHIEPQETKVLIRFRIDGQLHLQTEVDSKIAPALVQKLKLMSGLDISEKRTPHDGRFRTRVRNQPVDIRISIMPTVHGESVVMRLLMQNRLGFSLEKLGMPEEMLLRFRRLLSRSNGMVLVTGPTGSGKSTTLYAGLSELNTSNKKIITVEDPVEYRLAGISQIQINEKINLGFAKILRSVLRQDPDVILIGEMRDQETAQIAMRAAMTGHLVLSTLHTNDTISTAGRIIDMGVEPFVVAMSLLAVIAQRLLRMVCEICAEPHVLDNFERAWLKLELGDSVDSYTFVQGKGCGRCNNTGYSGRIGVYALLEMNLELTDAISRHDIRHFRALAQQQMMGKDIRYNAVQLAITKRTSVSEAMWVSNQFEQL